MDYEKEYKKLKADILYAYLFAHTDSTKAVLEHILPELRKSEDEKVRKRLIAMCQHYIECYAFDQYNLDGYKEALAWLEKQGQKDAVEATVKVDAGGYPYIPAMELYDYTEDKPLAKEGDKVKLIFIKKD